MRRVFLFISLAAVLASAGLVHAGDVTSPGDTIIGIPDDGDWPGGETPPNAIDDNYGTKFLHFKGETEPTGFRVTPSVGSTIVGGLTFATAGDAPDRDPVFYELYGSNESIDGPYMLIAAGEIVDFNGPTEWPRDSLGTTPILFPPVAPFEHYQILMTVRNPGGANSMQIAEVELLEGEAPINGWPPSVKIESDAAELLRLPDDTIELGSSVFDYDSAPESISYQWSQASGPAAVTFNVTEDPALASVTYPDVSGVYSVQLQITDDMGNDANDIFEVRVWGLDPDDDLVGHWKFNDGPDSLVAADSAGGNTGVLGSRLEGGDPNWMTGWIPSEDPENWALDFLDLGYVKIDPNGLENAASLDQEWAITIAAWFKPISWLNDDETNANRRILQKGLTDNQYRLLAENDQFRFHLAGVGSLNTALPTTGVWHHVAATYDHSTMKIFFDGVEVASRAASGNIDTSEDPLYIGTKSEDVDPADHPGDYFNGKMDDVRVYGRPLTQSEVRDLVAMGLNAACAIDEIIAPEELVLSVVNYIDLDAVVFDAHDDVIDYLWTSSDPVNVTFEPGDVEDPRVVFAAEGTYTLRLTIDDGVYGMDDSIYKEVTITVSNPTCQETIDAGYTIAGDLNDDCHVNLEDLAIMALNWTKCITPGEDGCDNPWAAP
jgi:hypothetical protein